MSALRVAGALFTLGLIGGRPTPGLAATTGDPLTLTSGFYVDPGSSAAAYVRRHPEDTVLASAIAAQPSARWFGAWSGDVKAAVTSYTTAAAKAAKLPMLVTDNLPGRQCGTGGGAESAAAYRTWIAAVSAGIGTRPAAVVLEPDALARLECYPNTEWTGRIAMLKYAVGLFAANNPNTWTYLDAGNVSSGDSAEMARRLRLADVGKIRGFALNTANYYTTSESTTRANDILTALGGGLHYVLDTSRNGNGSTGSSCNPPGAKLGTPPATGSSPTDATLWLKPPGESDGPCGLTPTLPFATFSPVLAHHLISGT
jgi:endoglucanase